MGNPLALVNAALSAANSVALRHTAARSQLVPSTFGLLVTALVAWPFAPHLGLTIQQVALI